MVYVYVALDQYLPCNQCHQRDGGGLLRGEVLGFQCDIASSIAMYSANVPMRSLLGRASISSPELKRPSFSGQPPGDCETLRAERFELVIEARRQDDACHFVRFLDGREMSGILECEEVGILQ